MTAPQPPDSWYASPFFTHVGYAYDWHVRPSALGLCEADEDTGVMIAYSQTRAKMQAIEKGEQRRAAERSKAKPGRSMGRHRKR